MATYFSRVCVVIVTLLALPARQIQFASPRLAVAAMLSV
jgi:hypothetical protein